jgi:prolyl-tRNA editing enzyme YbaK/EbsC (Cys-tRNA(Pro) deacylase)
VAPVGLPSRIEAFVDESLLPRSEIGAAGSDRALFRLTPSQLVYFTGRKTILLADPEKSPGGQLSEFFL